MKIFSFFSTIVEWLVNWLIPPPPTKICGSKGGPPITATRVVLRDGRHLAYAESGVNKADARYKIVFCNGLSRTRNDVFPVSQDVLEKLGVYIVAFDRPGFGESDPHPNRSISSMAFDIEELADALCLGSKFYMIGRSIGSYALWGALKHIPKRLAGVVFIAPLINIRLPGFPPDLIAEAYKKRDVGDQWTERICYYAPSILHWWSEQNWLPGSSILNLNKPMANKGDDEILRRQIASGTLAKRRNMATQQGKYESFYREFKVMFGKWELNPMDLPEPGCPVHVFQGDDDVMISVQLQRYLTDQIKWIDYHELPGVGHGLFMVPGLGERILMTLLGETNEN